jgi:membrane peptidoglycan carboxypeptidase
VGGTKMDKGRAFRRGAGIALALGATIGVGAVLYELHSSTLQSHLLADLGRRLSYSAEPGSSPAIRFPASAPYDDRMGYSRLPEFIERLQARGFAVESQARLSPEMVAVADRGLNLPYHAKTRAGLEVVDCRGDALFRARFPERGYERFEDVPPLLVQALLFIENRELLDPTNARKNPAVEWDRLGRAVLDQLIALYDPEHDTPGGSTLATQIEKYRHSPDGRTGSAREKLRQMGSASVRAYIDGEDTTAVRRGLVLDYLNTVPLSARPGVGEVNGIGDGLAAWYGRDLAEVNALLASQSPSEQLARAEAFKQALSLLVAERRPSFYLLQNHAALDQLTNVHLRLLADAGIISPALREAATVQRLVLADPQTGDAPPLPFALRKAATTARAGLGAMLSVPRLYDVDRLDLAAQASLDLRLQQSVTRVLRELRDPDKARAADLIQPKLLERGDPSKVTYSFTLMERTPHGNRVRVQTDNLEQMFDINEGAKLDLGSTAKLRTFVNYLEIVAALHEQYGELDRKALAKVDVARQDAITRWAVDWLAEAKDRSLDAMLEGALARTYSASPGEQFFTGGGMHTFENFDPNDNGRILTVREGLRRSVNLVFVRLMRDIFYYYRHRVPGSSAKLLDDENDPARQKYLARFADREGREFITRFFRKYQGKGAEEMEQILVQGIRPRPRRLAAIYRTIAPDASPDGFKRFVAAYMPSADTSDAALERLWHDHDPERMSLTDRGFVAGVHPLELWVVGHLRANPGASFAQVVQASAEERQEVYGWLFRTRNKNAQDARIRQLIEIEAFLEVHKAWARLGYPFASIVPSYATTLGASADRPAALAELMGILVNDGVRMPTVRLERLHFARGTPYETLMSRVPVAGEQVLPPEVARLTRTVLNEVVEHGTATRLRGVFRGADGKPIPVGGKTGTGDHRFETYGKGGVVLTSEVVSRSGTFVFFLGDRHFGTLTAYVRGPEADQFAFTSGLPVQILKTLAPALGPTIAAPVEASGACAAAPRPADDIAVLKRPAGPATAQ